MGKERERLIELKQKMASQSEGIQKLLDAEKEATRLVDDARKYKAQRLKAAKSEAKEETAQFQKEQESKFDEISKVYKDGKIEAQIEKQVEETIAEMDKRVKANEG